VVAWWPGSLVAGGPFQQNAFVFGAYSRTQIAQIAQSARAPERVNVGQGAGQWMFPIQAKCKVETDMHVDVM
jgi:hypothetical protein